MVAPEQLRASLRGRPLATQLALIESMAAAPAIEASPWILPLAQRNTRTQEQNRPQPSEVEADLHYQAWSASG